MLIGSQLERNESNNNKIIMCRERRIHPAAAWAAAGPDSGEGAGGFQLINMNICLPRKDCTHPFSYSCPPGAYSDLPLSPLRGGQRAWIRLRHFTLGAMTRSSSVPASQGGNLAPRSHRPCQQSLWWASYVGLTFGCEVKTISSLIT